MKKLERFNLATLQAYKAINEVLIEKGIVDPELMIQAVDDHIKNKVGTGPTVRRSVNNRTQPKSKGKPIHKCKACDSRMGLLMYDKAMNTTVDIKRVVYGELMCSKCRNSEYVENPISLLENK